jgi:uncharacterized protein (DUF433 family)
MSQVAEVIDKIEKLDSVDREQVLHRLSERFPPMPARSISELYPNIVSTPGVCGGVARIIRTRIPVWTLERIRQLGVSESEILRSYPTLRAVDLVQAWSYADSHRQEIELQIKENEEE